MRALLTPVAFTVVVMTIATTCSCAAADAAPALLDELRVEIADPDTDARAAVVQHTGIAATNFLGQRLVTELMAALKRGTIEDAFAIAHLQRIGADGQTIPGMPTVRAFKLTSLKLINAANSPDYAEKRVLDSIERGLRSATKPPDLIVQHITLPDGSEEWRAYRPLAVLPTCVSCHGPSARMSPRVRTLLAQRATAAPAVDYKAGEWRGLIRVTIDPPPGGV